MLLAAGRLRRGPPFYPGAEPPEPHDWWCRPAVQHPLVAWLPPLRAEDRARRRAESPSRGPSPPEPHAPVPAGGSVSPWALGFRLDSRRRAVLVDADSPSRGLRSVWHPP